VFIGTFTAEAADAAIHCGRRADAGTLNTLDALVSKSLLSTLTGDDGAERFRLLETTRLYGLERLHESGEAALTARHHAEYFAKLLNSRHGGQIDLEYTGRAHALREHLGNVRAALEWCFAQRDNAADAALAVDLAAAASPVFFELSLLSEAYKWSAAGLAALDATTRGSRREMLLQSTFAISAMWLRGNNDEVLAAIARGLQLAPADDEPSQRGAMLEPVQRLHRTHPRVVHNVRSRLGVPREADRGRVQRAGVTVIQQLERTRVPHARQSIQQRLIALGVRGSAGRARHSVSE